ncbi:hypothetical protein GCM10017559_71020 [Streptosporangium longisporum]|uniref:DUF4873 domain-containing protein n=2 Tax=Streptosporangium longisporum TaxID=46187 RepID=A0ABP6L8N2_9ACTN
MAMSLTSDDYSVHIDGHTVEVTGKTGPVHARWALLVDGREIDSAKAAGDFTLKGTMPDGSAVRAEVHQSLMGPTEVVVHHRDQEVTRFHGFVA